MRAADTPLSGWLDGQERMLRAWLHEAVREPKTDSAWIARLEGHLRWLREERDALTGAAKK